MESENTSEYGPRNWWISKNNFISDNNNNNNNNNNDDDDDDDDYDDDNKNNYNNKSRPVLWIEKCYNIPQAGTRQTSFANTMVPDSEVLL
jgi:hypothetical protein